MHVTTSLKVLKNCEGFLTTSGSYEQNTPSINVHSSSCEKAKACSGLKTKKEGLPRRTRVDVAKNTGKVFTNKTKTRTERYNILWDRKSG